MTSKIVYKVRSHRDPPHAVPERMDPNSKTEKHGHVPLNKRIEEMVLAGQRLDRSRMGYDTLNPNDPDPEIDPTRRKDYDLAEATQEQNAVTDRLQDSAKKAVEASQSAQKDKERSQATEKAEKPAQAPAKAQADSAK